MVLPVAKVAGRVAAGPTQAIVGDPDLLAAPFGLRMDVRDRKWRSAGLSATVPRSVVCLLERLASSATPAAVGGFEVALLLLFLERLESGEDG